MAKDFKDTFIGKLTKPNGIEIDFDKWEGLSYETKKTALKELKEWFIAQEQPEETTETFHLSAPEGFIALSALNELIAQVRKEHPYRVIGDFDTYTDFNQGWQDALDRLDSLLPTVED